MDGMEWWSAVVVASYQMPFFCKWVEGIVSCDITLWHCFSTMWDILWRQAIGGGGPPFV
jgi:hypothetical protein